MISTIIQKIRVFLYNLYAMFLGRPPTRTPPVDTPLKDNPSTVRPPTNPPPRDIPPEANPPNNDPPKNKPYKDIEMAKVKVFWDPKGIEIDSLGSKEFLRITDGDTPYVSMSIRMLSIDTPEVHYPGNAKPSRQDDELAQLAGWITEGHAPIEPGLAAYLQPKLATGSAGTLQEDQGDAATDAFQVLLDEKLTRPTGSKRRVYLSTADEQFDQYGRVLAYMAPYYSRAERESLSPLERASFNLMMVASGWAATFPIYPSIPKYNDLVLLREVAKEAYQSNQGAWENDASLTGYEFRMCVKLHKITKRLLDGENLSSSQRRGWISRYCVDMTTLQIYFPQDYYQVAPWNRIFIWPDDVNEAVGKMNLVPAG